MSRLSVAVAGITVAAVTAFAAATSCGGADMGLGDAGPAARRERDGAEERGRLDASDSMDDADAGLDRNVAGDVDAAANADASMDGPPADGSPADVCSTSCSAPDCDAPTLSSWCAGEGGSDCPPALASPGYDAWLLHHVKTPGSGGIGGGLPRYVGCYKLPCCPETVYISFGIGKDCGQIYVFDVSTHQLVAGTEFCAGLPCDAFHMDGCLASACLPTMFGWGAPSMLCPAFPDAGADAGPG